MKRTFVFSFSFSEKLLKGYSTLACCDRCGDVRGMGVW